MKLVSFSVSNFRSIIEAKKVPLSDYAILVGANNEGKSNILNALALAMKALVQFKWSLRRDRSGRVMMGSPMSQILRRVDYDWKRDFPVSKQNSSAKKKITEITLDFLLTENECTDFVNKIDSKIDGKLPIVMTFSENDLTVSIAKPGRGNVSLNRKSTRIAEFISERINFEYIPAIRTAQHASDVVSDLIAGELTKLEKKPEFENALRVIEQLQQPILNELANSVQGTISNFLPSVRKVEFSIRRADRLTAFSRNTLIEIDDGNVTILERKGDGIKSLVALALMRHASEKASTSASTIIAIEEPESHLHPKAIHELRMVIAGLASKNQVVLSSHSPLFVDPSRLESTIIVNANKATCAKNIGEVRDVLGVRLSDNLQSARLVALLEGEDDQIVIPSFIAALEPRLERAIKSGDLVFDNLGGASNLSYKIRLYKSSACLVQCLLDSDKSGINASKTAIADGAIQEADYNLLFASGLQESELEDLFNPRLYKDAFLEQFGVDPTTKPNGSAGKKWSDAMDARFKLAGKTWTKETKMKTKIWLAKYAREAGLSILIEGRKQPLEAFAATMVRKLGL
ncbi:MAG: ATP-dependent nuclease [Alphaproteobacteria bacterium]